MASGLRILADVVTYHDKCHHNTARQIFSSFKSASHDVMPTTRLVFVRSHSLEKLCENCRWIKEMTISPIRNIFHCEHSETPRDVAPSCDTHRSQDMSSKETTINTRWNKGAKPVQMWQDVPPPYVICKKTYCVCHRFQKLLCILCTICDWTRPKRGEHRFN